MRALERAHREQPCRGRRRHTPGEAVGADADQGTGEGEGVEGERLRGLDHGDAAEAQVALEQDHRHRPQGVDRHRQRRHRDHPELLSMYARGRQGGQRDRCGGGGEGEPGREEEAADRALLLRRRVLVLADKGGAEPGPADHLGDALHRRRQSEEPVIGGGEEPGEDERDAGREQLQQQRAADQDPDAAGRGFRQ